MENLFTDVDLQKKIIFLVQFCTIVYIPCSHSYVLDETEHVLKTHKVVGLRYDDKTERFLQS